MQDERALRSCIEPLIENVRRCLVVGVKDQPVELKSAGSRSFPVDNKQGVADIYHVSLPVAGLMSSWELHFDKKRPDLPPDIVFDNDKFLPLPHEVQSLANWTSSSSKALSKLLAELFDLYVEFNLQCVEDFHQLKDEWDSVMSSTDYGKHCEVSVLTNGPGTFNTTVSFLFEIEVNLDDIPEYLKQGEHGSIGKDKACLEVTFHPPDQSKVISKLFLSPAVEKVVGGQGVLRIPQYGRLSMSGYIQHIETIVIKAIQDVTVRYTKRKEFIMAVIDDYSSCLLEYDSLTFYQISILLENNGFYTNVMVKLTNQFPAEQPLLLLQSIYHTLDEEVLQESYQDYLYSPRWDSKLMLEKIREYLEEILQSFREEATHFAKST